MLWIFSSVRLSAVLLFLISSVGGTSPPLSNGPWGQTNPIANEDAIIIFDNARFTILTDRLIRMEEGIGEDRKTLAVVNRNLKVPKFSCNVKDGRLTITTYYLHLEYVIGQPFSKQSLQIKGKMNKLDNTTSWTWKYGDPGDDGNLLGTIRTLDRENIVSLKCSDQPVASHCVDGLISRNGFSLVDDSKNWALDDNDWWESINVNDIDFYIFGHGHDYKAALVDYIKIGGRIPLLPRYAFGVWFSRWYDYNPASIRSTVDKYEQHSVPLDVFVLDMNWHTKDDWTGYSWDSHLYYPSEDAIAYLKHKNLAVTMNLHDANGVSSWETQYLTMCEAIQCDASAKDKIEFSIVNQTIVYALEDTVLKPLEDVNGVDFWWIDWQQDEHSGGGDGDMKNPTIWTAHTRSTDRNRRHQTQRSMVLARWGGLGAHRYPVHFSGDAAISWSQLSFQPYFSMTAINVGAIWSHDIAAQVTDPELFTRWLQFGAVSGITRTHDKGTSAGICALQEPETCSAVEPWNGPPKYAEANYRALRMRGKLIPYIYTAAYTAHTNGLWLTRPLYYDWPELEGAYITASPHPDSSLKYESQYMFGDDLLVAPVVRPGNTTTGLASIDLWIPPGIWVGFLGGRVVSGSENEGSPLTAHADLSEIPLFAKAGSVIPTIPIKSGSTISLAMRQYERLIWTVYLSSGAPLTGNGHLYEDDGATTAYLSHHASFNSASYSINEDKAKIQFTVHTPLEYEGKPSTRSMTIRFVNVAPPSKVLAMKKVIPFSRFGGLDSWSYDAMESAVVVDLSPVDVSTALTIDLDSTIGNVALDGLGFKITKALEAKETLDQIRKVPGSYETPSDHAFLMQAASVGSSLEYFANDEHQFFATVDLFHALMEKAIVEIEDLLKEISKLGAIWNLRTQRRSLKVGLPTKIVNRILRAYVILKETE